VVATGAAATDVDAEMAAHWPKRDAAGLARTLRRAIELGRFTALSQSLGMGLITKKRALKKGVLNCSFKHLACS